MVTDTLYMVYSEECVLNEWVCMHAHLHLYTYLSRSLTVFNSDSHLMQINLPLSKERKFQDYFPLENCNHFISFLVPPLKAKEMFQDSLAA